MANLRVIRNLCSRTLNVGKARITFVPSGDKFTLQNISEIRTRAGVRMLLRRGIITVKRKVPSSSPRKKSIRRIAQGTHKVRYGASRQYVDRIRILRERLKQRSKDISDRQAYWKVYRSLKSGRYNIFRTLDNRLKELVDA